MSLETFSKNRFVFNKHPELVGRHAILSPSKCSWVNYDIDEIDKLYSMIDSSYAAVIGTNLHYAASHYINCKFKLRKNDIRIVAKDLNDWMRPFDGSEPKLSYIPIGMYDLHAKYENLSNFVNDAIGFDMNSEVPLSYSESAFGTADAISFKDGLLRIHDYKSGTTKPKMEQLYTYAALFCLEYKVPVSEIQIETRIYQANEELYSMPTIEEIGPIMDRIVTFDKRIREIRNEVN